MNVSNLFTAPCGAGRLDKLIYTSTCFVLISNESNGVENRSTSWRFFSLAPMEGANFT